MSNITAPKVFISHASEDKERFVESFATRLRENGVDAWLDKWEIKSGDSLIGKIFEEGLENAEIIIVVISKFSITKSWVKEELRAALIKKIKAGCRLIPIILDECEPPITLQDSAWEKITDLDNYDANFDRIINCVFKLDIKPKIGKPPNHVKETISTISDLTPIDSLILKISCEYLLENNDSLIDSEAFLRRQHSEPYIPEDLFKESLEVLNCKGYIKLFHTSMDFTYSISFEGFEKYAQNYISNYSHKINRLAALIYNKSSTNSGNIIDNKTLQAELNIPFYLVNHILELLTLDGCIEALDFDSIDGSKFFRANIPTLKRRIDSYT